MVAGVPITKSRTLYRCSACTAESPQWQGRCGSCGEWNTLAEERSTGRPVDAAAGNVPPVSLAAVSTEVCVPRPTGIIELDRVLGGGITAGSVTLLGGEPGIGKSTLVLQLCNALAGSGLRCLVITGEESVQQVARRAERLGVTNESVSLLAESDMETILRVIGDDLPDLVVVDSVQTMSATGLASTPGTVTQVRECAQALTALAKSKNVAMLLVGHVTKEGTLAGPRVLEHVVDTVLEFEGDRHHELRFLRAAKHRFGATDEVGVFEMTEQGLMSVPDASGLFLDDRRAGVSGSVVAPIIQGRRPLLVEIQALVSASSLPQPRRVSQGIDGGRVSLIMAVLAKRTGMSVGMSDVYVSVVGGVRVDEPGTDLGLALAIASSHLDCSAPGDSIAIGEVGLGGEVRRVTHMAKRLTEAARMGFRRALVPPGCPEGPAGLELVSVSTLHEALGVMDLSCNRRSTRER